MPHHLLTQHSSHLWISDPKTVESNILANLQKALCTHDTCKQCTPCLQISNKTHPWITWLEPDNGYSLDQINDVINSVQFILDQTEKRFFIFTKAEELTSACCNRLLKTIEEPHDGYHFIFLTNRPEAILATLRSRCVQKSFTSQEAVHAYQNILEPFTSLHLKNPILFMRQIDKLQIKETATKEIIDLLLEHFHTKLKLAVQNNQPKEINLYLDLLIIVKKQLQQLPLSGSSKLFWKNFYLHFHQKITCLKN